MSSKYANENETASVGGGNFTPAPAGNHIANIIGIAILGTIETSFEGRISRKKMVRLYLELTNKKNEEDEGKPFVVGKDFTNSMHKNAGLRKLIEGGWGSMTDDQAEVFNLVDLLGCQCMVNVSIETATKSGKQYNDIIGLAPIPDGMPIPDPVNEEFLFNFNLPFKEAEFNRLENFVQDKIKTSDEWLALVGSPSTAHVNPSQPRPVQNASAGFVPDNGTTKKKPF